MCRVPILPSLSYSKPARCYCTNPTQKFCQLFVQTTQHDGGQDKELFHPATEQSTTLGVNNHLLVHAVSCISTGFHRIAGAFHRIAGCLPVIEPPQKSPDLGEPKLIQLQRRPGAGLLGWSGAVKGDLSLLGQFAVALLDLG